MITERLQIFHLRYLVDPSGYYQSHCRSGPNHPHSGAYVETINKLIRVSRQLLQELGREPTPGGNAEEMHMSVERVREILKISQEPVSLETPIGEEEDSHLGDFIQDDNVPVPADAAAFTMLKEQLEDVLSTLTDREQKVLRLRFGLERRACQNPGGSGEKSLT